jgi:hypothetical protein
MNIRNRVYVWLSGRRHRLRARPDPFQGAPHRAAAQAQVRPHTTPPRRTGCDGKCVINPISCAPDSSYPGTHTLFLLLLRYFIHTGPRNLQVDFAALAQRCLLGPLFALREGGGLDVAGVCTRAAPRWATPRPPPQSSPGCTAPPPTLPLVAGTLVWMGGVVCGQALLMSAFKRVGEPQLLPATRLGRPQTLAGCGGASSQPTPAAHLPLPARPPGMAQRVRTRPLPPRSLSRRSGSLALKPASVCPPPLLPP